MNSNMFTQVWFLAFFLVSTISAQNPVEASQVVGNDVSTPLAAPIPVQAPVSVATPVIAETPAVLSNPAPAPNLEGISAPGVTGFVTEHKGPDGSVITVTRFNGNIPQSAFPTIPNIFATSPFYQYPFLNSPIHWGGYRTQRAITQSQNKNYKYDKIYKYENKAY